MPAIDEAILDIRAKVKAGDISSLDEEEKLLLLKNPVLTDYRDEGENADKRDNRKLLQNRMRTSDR